MDWTLERGPRGIKVKAARMGPGSYDQRAGRPKRYFTITAYGKKALAFTRDTRNELWEAIPQVAWDIKFAG